MPTDGEAEEGEEMDATNDDDAAMMAMMGMSGFGSTKVRDLLASCFVASRVMPLDRASTSKGTRRVA